MQILSTTHVYKCLRRSWQRAWVPSLLGPWLVLRYYESLNLFYLGFVETGKLHSRSRHSSSERRNKTYNKLKNGAIYFVVHLMTGWDLEYILSRNKQTSLNSRDHDMYSLAIFGWTISNVNIKAVKNHHGLQKCQTCPNHLVHV